jgi:CubicO group peptidase (beta-lactamase class C family)
VIVSAQIVGGREITDAFAGAILPWWSFTKTVTAACAFKLAEQGRLDLDAPLAGKPFTLRQLLAHRAGVRDYGGIAAYHAAVARGDTPWPVEELLARARSDELLFPPGQGWSYSNIGYLFVSQAIERATDSSLRSALQEIAFAPLGIQAAVVHRREDMQRVLWPQLHRYDPNWVYHGLILGTAIDAARFLDRLFTTEFLSEASRNAMLDSIPLPFAVTGRPFRKPTVGTGLMMDPEGPLGPWYGHTGGGPYSSSAVYRFPALNRTVAAFADHEDSGTIERTVLDLARQ